MHGSVPLQLGDNGPPRVQTSWSQAGFMMHDGTQVAARQVVPAQQSALVVQYAVEHLPVHVPPMHAPLQHSPLFTQAAPAARHCMLHCLKIGSQTSPGQQSKSLAQPTPAGSPGQGLHQPLSAPCGISQGTPSQQCVVALQTPPTGAHDVPQRLSFSQWPLQQSESTLQSKPFSPQIIVAHAFATHDPEQHWASMVQAVPDARHTTAPQ
jgi:hypothetical protein